MRLRRRDLLRGSTALVGAGALATTGCGPTFASSVTPPAELAATIEWIEQTPRGRIFEVAAQKLGEGLTTRELLAALLVASARSLPLKPLGLWLHPFFVLRSVEQMALDATFEDRLVPYLFALDMFKNGQGETEGSSDDRLGTLDESAVPPTGADSAFRAAMDAWDSKGADAAAVGLLRSGSSRDVMEALLLYGCRDLAPIGHHIIAVTQVLRTLDHIGWDYGEIPVRALAIALLEAGADGASTEAFGASRARAATVRSDWEAGAPSDATSLEVLSKIRKATSAEALALAADLLDAGASPRSILDGILLADAELVVRFPTGSEVFAAFHALTNANGFRHVFRTSTDPETRLLAVLQAAAFYPLDRDEAIARAGSDASTFAIDAWSPTAMPATAAAVMTALENDRIDGAGAVFAWSKNGGSDEELMHLARSAAIAKGGEEHDYKLPVAVFEELEWVAPSFRAHVLAAAFVYMRIPSEVDWGRYAEARAATASIGGG
jgi:hypothetical protein